MQNNITAIEWLRQELEVLFLDTTPYEGIFDNAKEMEKDQIINAYSMGVSDEGIKSIHTRANAEEFYNETYGE
jgi:hypothetical protein